MNEREGMTRMAEANACRPENADAVIDGALLQLAADVPPMPEEVHRRWMKKVEETPMKERDLVLPEAKDEPHAADMTEEKEAPVTDRAAKAARRARMRRGWLKGLAAAAALVVVLAGTSLTKERMSARKSADTPYVSAAQDDFPEPAPYARMAGNGANALYSAPNEGAYGDADYGAVSCDTDAYEAETYSASEESAAGTDARMIVRHVTLRITAEDLGAAAAALRDGCERAGGWVESVTESGRDAYLTVRVPATALDGFLEGADGTGRVTYREESADDVTDSYTDLKTRLAAQEVLRARLMDLTATAAELSDLLALEEKLADVQYNIDSLTGRMQSTEKRVTYATVNITLRQATPQTAVGDAELTLGRRVGEALAMGWDDFVGFLGDVCVFLAAALPVIVLLAAAVSAILLARRARRAKKQ